MRISISVLDLPNKFDVTVSTVLPTKALESVRRTVRSISLMSGSPAQRAGLLATAVSVLIPLHDETGCVEISNKVVYDGYIVTINLADKRICVGNVGDMHYFNFDDLDAYCEGDDYADCES